MKAAREVTRVTAIACAIVVFVAPTSASTADATVPIALQGELLVKVAAYDRSMPARAGNKAHVLVVVKPGVIPSENAAKQMLNTLSSFSTIAGLPHDEEIVTFASAAQLAAVCKQKHAAIVYVTPGFDEGEVAAMGTAFVNVDVLSAGAVAGYVPNGVVLGFDLVSSKPKLLVSLGQAKKQNVAFKAEVLKLMKVYP
jgi:hypothetical protein